MPRPDRSEDIARARHLVEREGYNMFVAAKTCMLDYGHLTRVADDQKWDRSRVPAITTLLKRFPWGRHPIGRDDLTEDQARHAIFEAKKCGCTNVREWLLETLRDAIDEEIAQKQLTQEKRYG